jgi:hypothetical protein
VRLEIEMPVSVSVQGLLVVEALVAHVTPTMNKKNRESLLSTVVTNKLILANELYGSSESTAQHFVQIMQKFDEYLCFLSL